MIGLDTNVLVRHLVQDEPVQSARTTRLRRRSCRKDIGLVVLAETVWVLQRLYRATADEITEIVEDLLRVTQPTVENRTAVTRALKVSANGDCAFADALIAASANVAALNRREP